MGVLRMPMPWHQAVVRENDDDAVILLHGLWRSLWAMEPMAQFLHQNGYQSINVPYPSFRKPIDELAALIHRSHTAPRRPTKGSLCHTLARRSPGTGITPDDACRTGWAHCDACPTEPRE